MKNNKIMVIEEPKVTNNLNLSMSTSDLIELYIEENIDRIKNELSVLLNNKSTFLKKSENEEVSKIFFDYYKKLKLPFKLTKVNFQITNTKTTKVEDFYYNEVNRNYEKVDRFLEELKYLSIQNKCYQFYEKSLVNIDLRGDGYSLEINKKHIPSSLLEKIEPFLNDFEKEKQDILEYSKNEEKIYKLVEEYRETNNTRKVKAKFTKKQLLQTEEGAKILNFISSIDTIKALN